MDSSKALLEPSTFVGNKWAGQRSATILLGMLDRYLDTQVRVRLPNGDVRSIGRGSSSLQWVVHHGGCFQRILSGGSMGLAESYLDGEWDCNDLAAFLRALSRTSRGVGPLVRGTSALLRARNAMLHRARHNNKANARRNIQAHYDLSNDLYGAFLDDTMMYSAALFEGADRSLRDAQVRKLDRIIEELNVGPNDTVLEIGSGWGGCAIRLAQTRGCKVVSVTLSEEQLVEATARAQNAGVENLVEFRLQDYRDIAGEFDAIVSIEMIEAVGSQYLSVYADKCRGLLRPGGRLVLQAITIPDDRYESYSKGNDYIRKYIFPGGHLPSPSVLAHHFEQENGLKKVDELEFGQDYAETLRRWETAYRQNIDQVRQAGFDTTFDRKWLYYFAYCEAGFDEGMIHVRHVTYEA